MNLKKLIEKLITEGKSDLEIANAIMSHEESKGMDVDDAASLIVEAKKSVEIQAKLAEISKKDAEKKEASEKEKEIEQKLFSKLDEKLKTIQLSTGQFSGTKTQKKFNPITGQVEEFKNTEAVKAFAEMFGALANDDMASAQKISSEIDKDNEKIYKEIGYKASLVSDVGDRGGLSVPTELEDGYMMTMYTESIMYRLANKNAIQYNQKLYPMMYGLSVYDIADESTTLAESQPTIAAPSVDMKRMGSFTYVSKELLRQKSPSIVAALQASMGSAFARFLDLRLAVGSVTGNSDLVNGIVFDANTNVPSSIALADLTIQNLRTLIETLTDEAEQSGLAFIGNRKVAGKIGLLEYTSGNPIFPNFVQNGSFSPFGVPFYTNPKIGSSLNISGGARTGGTNDVLILADMSKVICGISPETRIEVSDQFRFTTDQVTFKGVKRYGQKVVAGASNLGIHAIAQTLTN